MSELEPLNFDTFSDEITKPSDKTIYNLLRDVPINPTEAQVSVVNSLEGVINAEIMVAYLSGKDLFSLQVYKNRDGRVRKATDACSFFLKGFPFKEIHFTAESSLDSNSPYPDAYLKFQQWLLISKAQGYSFTQGSLEFSDWNYDYSAGAGIEFENGKLIKLEISNAMGRRVHPVFIANADQMVAWFKNLKKNGSTGFSVKAAGR